MNDPTILKVSWWSRNHFPMCTSHQPNAPANALDFVKPEVLNELEG
jgi:hypothetical protein